VQHDWWTLFRSPDLDSVVKQAITGNLTLDGAKARLAQPRDGKTASRGCIS
jgi:outer membrane protein TolC